MTRRSPRTAATMLPHVADALAAPRFGLARAGVRSCSTIVNDLSRWPDAVAALMLSGCRTAAAYLPARRTNGVRLAIGVAALLFSGCRT